MKKKFVLGILLVSLLIVLGYFCIKNKPNIAVLNPSNNINKDSNEGKSKGKNSHSQKEYGVKLDDTTMDITKTFINETDRVRFFHIVNSEKAFIATEKSQSSGDNNTINIKSINLLTGEVDKEIVLKKEKANHNFYPLTRGFYIVEKFGMGKDEKLLYHVYDNELKLIKSLDLSDIKKLKINSIPKISNNGDKLAYIKRSGKYESIYVSGLELISPKEICKVEYYNLNKLSTLEDITFVDGDEKIAFKGSIFKNENLSPKAFGMVSLSTGELTYKEQDGIDNIISTTKEKTLFIDAETERGKDSSGKVWTIENDNSTIDEYMLQDKNESQKAIFSDKGNFIVTLLKGKTKADEPICKFRVYDIKLKKLVHEFDYSFKDAKISSFSVRDFKLCEDNEGIYVVYIFENETKLYEHKVKASGKK